MKPLKKFRNIILGLLLVAVCAVTWHVWSEANKEVPVSEEYEWNSTLEEEYIEYNDQKYIRNQKIETVLLGGVDKEGKINLAGGNKSGGETDSLFLLVINNNTRTVDKIQINRDTMAQVNILNDNYNVEDTKIAQIALAHAYGNGGSVSCKNTVDSVEKLFFDIEIDKYFFMNMGAIPTLNNFFGGVEVIIRDDFSSVDPTLVRGRRIKLDGRQAYTYLRAREGMDNTDNQKRMERHRLYVDGMIDNAMESIKSNEATAMELYNDIYDYTATTLSASEITALILKTADYTFNDTITLEGEFSDESELAEFYPDDEKLRELVLKLFYVAVNEE